MSLESDMSKKNTILKMKTGSQLYGTSTPSSDIDYSGIFIADEDYYFGLRRVDEVDHSSISKQDNGKNDSDAVDDKLYEIRKIANLAMQNNPNIIEHLFVNEPSIVFINEFGRELLNHKHLFPYKGAYDKFIGYAISQKHKIIIKEKHFSELSVALRYFSEQESHSIIVEFREKGLTFLSENTNYFVIGDLNFQKHSRIKKVLEILRERMSKISNRYELVTKYGYDTKFSMHLIRLLLEGKELLKTGEIVFPLKDRKFLLDIRSGKYKIEEILSISTQLENEMRDTKDRSILSNQPRFKEINDLIKKITKNFLIR